MIYLDTHVVIWLYARKGEGLSTRARRLIEDEPEIAISPMVQQFPLQNDLTYSNYYKLPKIVYDENFNSLILQQKIYLRKTNNINMLDFRFVNLFKQNTVISTG